MKYLKMQPLFVDSQVLQTNICSMKYLFLTFSALIVSLASMAYEESVLSPKDPLVGYYKGRIEGATRYPFNVDKNMCAEIHRGPEGYRIRLMSDVMTRSEIHAEVGGLKAESDSIKLDAAGDWKLSGTIKPEGFTLAAKVDGKDALLKFEPLKIVSPTMGKRPPKGALVLFDGSGLDEWKQAFDGTPCVWNLKDGAMISKGLEKNGKKCDGSIVSKRNFGALRMHIEFKIPAEYSVIQYSRGNSGLYIGPYEIQILDSFGKDGNFGECGSIYRIIPPKVNACLEPEVWQTFDVEFFPAQFDGDKLVKNPVISVWQNGVRIHFCEEISRPTNLQPENVGYKHPQGKLPIAIQDHLHPVAFRNIWVEEIEK